MAKRRGTLLALVVLWALASPSLAWDNYVNDAIDWMCRYGYGSFANALRSTQLTVVMAKLLEKGHTLTILAPNDAAFNAYRGPQCCIPVDTVLSLHILDGTYRSSDFARANVGAFYPSGTAVPVVKKKNWPLTFGVYTGFLQWRSSTRVVQADIRINKYITIHGVKSVLQYPCYSRFY